MAHNPTITASATCNHESVLEYWHENDQCGSDQCGVNECSDCGAFATECGQTE